MKLTRFRSERGSVELIEASYTIPFIIILILTISLLTLNFVNAVYKKEAKYLTAKKIGNYFERNYSGESILKNINYSILNFSREKFNTKYFFKKKFLNNEVEVENIENGKAYNIKIINNVNFTRKTDILFEVFRELSEIEIRGFSIKKFQEKILKKFEGMKNSFNNE